jgi:succinate dehydrogenase/fumarate reductase flavoprotein subunit
MKNSLRRCVMSEAGKAKGINRRGFLKTTAVGAGGVLAVLVSGKAEGTTLPKKWDKEADIIIVGFGGAGAAAAIEARDAGSSVIILEKMPHAGGNTGVAGGFMAIPKDLEEGIKYQRAQTFGTVEDEEMIRSFVENIMKVPDWLRSLGAETRSLPPPIPGTAAAMFPKLPGSESLKDLQRIYPGGNGQALFKVLFDQVMKKKADVFYETPARKLVKDPGTGAIRGVIAEHQGKAISMKARKAVILSCGGYAANADMLQQHNLPGVSLYSIGSPGNTGDGIKMVSEVGAQLWHNYCFEWFRYGIKPASDYLKVGVPTDLKPTASFIIVNKEGKRFTNDAWDITHTHENLEATRFKHNIPGYANIPFYAIFDEMQKKTGPVAALEGYMSYPVIHKMYNWSKDNETEINKGWVQRAETVRELAQKMGIPSEGLEETINKYNKSCQAGEDPEFGRANKTLIPVKAPPYYAMELCLTIINTMGGAKRNSKAQVVDYDNKPISRLYSAGEFGSFFGMIYQGGQNIPEALAFGRLAGKNGSAEKAWK